MQAQNSITPSGKSLYLDIKLLYSWADNAKLLHKYLTEIQTPRSAAFALERLSESFQEDNLKVALDYIVAAHTQSNPLFKELQKGGKSVESCVLEMDSDMNGIRRYLPRRKIKAYNERVDGLIKLVPGALYLKRHGILCPDNFATSFIEVTAGFYAIFAIFSAFADSSFLKHSAAHLFLLGSSSVCGLFFGAQLQREAGRKNYRVQSLEEARYVDKAVARL